MSKDTREIRDTRVSRDTRDRSRSRSVKDEKPRGSDRTLRGKRRRRPKYWDMTPDQALALGLPLERVQAQVPSQMGSDQNMCKIYVGFGNLPVAPSEEDLRQFFNVTMVAAQGADRTPGDSVIGVYISPDRRYGFISFRNMEEAEQSLSLDGIAYRGHRLRLGRASHAGGSVGSAKPRTLTNIKPLNVERLGILSTNVEDGPDKIYIGGLPNALNTQQVVELLQTYGQLKAFYLFTDAASGMSKGYAFANYRESSVTQTAIRGLNGLQVGDRRIVVKLADSSLGQNPTKVMSELGLGRQAVIQPSEVVCFLQMVTEADLMDQTEYAGIVEDIQEEAGKFGNVVNVVIPRPVAGQRISGVGKVFVQMATVEGASKVKSALEGRQFLGRTVLATYYDRIKFLSREL